MAEDLSLWSRTALTQPFAPQQTFPVQPSPLGANGVTFPTLQESPAKRPATQPEPAPTTRPRQNSGPLAQSPRMRLLPYGRTPEATAENRQQYSQYVEKTIDVNNTLDLILDRPRILVLKKIPFRIQITDPTVADYKQVTETELSVSGLKQGTTVLNLWFENPAAPDKQDVLSYLLRVYPDPEEKLRLEAVYKALEQEINRTFPDSVVKLSLVGDRLLIRGQAKDAEEATNILAIIGDNAPGGPEEIPVEKLNVNLVTGPGLPGAGAAVDGGDGNPFQTASLQNYLLRTDSTVINMLRIPGVQQVALRVTVAEVNRSAARAIGASLSITPSDSFRFFNFSPAGGAAASPTATSATGGTLVVNTSNFGLALNALKTLNLARSLAEPELTTLNGQPARFQVGGSFPVPQIGGFTGSGLQGVQFVPFGVQLQFIPIVMDGDRIRLQVAASVSTVDSTLINVAGSQVPNSLETRNFQTTVELREGQTLSVAGMIQNNMSGDSTRTPWVGDVPVLGRFFKQDSTTYTEQELIVLVTPYLVQPLDEQELLPLPGADYYEPSDLEFFLLGRLDSVRLADYRSPVRSNIYRKNAYKYGLDTTIPAQMPPHWRQNETQFAPRTAPLLTPPLAPVEQHAPPAYDRDSESKIDQASHSTSSRSAKKQEDPVKRYRRLQKTFIIGPSGYSDDRY